MLKKRDTSFPSQNNSGVNQMGELVSELLSAATKLHMAHLKTTSYASHMALGEFYDELPDMVDGIAEQYQGVTETLLNYSIKTVDPINTPEEAVAYLRKLYTMIDKYQSNCMYSEIINELDVIKSAINSTKYKLIFLK